VTRRAIGSERGFITVAVLWILGAVSALVLVDLRFGTTAAIGVAANTDRPQNEALFTAGIELAALQLTSAPGQARPASGTFDASIGPHRISVGFVSESARIDLNAASAPLLAGLFVGIGAKPDAADSYAARIVGWRSKAADPNDAETSFYRTSGSPYPPRHAPFPHPDELWLVRGIPAAMVERALPYLTTFSNQAGVSAAAAAPAVLAALPNMSPERLQAVIGGRSNPQADPGSLAGLAGEGASSELSNAYRIQIAARLDNGRSAAMEAVILMLDEADEPYRILSWRDRFDGVPTPQRIAGR
jgi:general secretion pathway protein K